jgi:hypothetical protein
MAQCSMFNAQSLKGSIDSLTHRSQAWLAKFRTLLVTVIHDRAPDQRLGQNYKLSNSPPPTNTTCSALTLTTLLTPHAESESGSIRHAMYTVHCVVCATRPVESTRGRPAGKTPEAEGRGKKGWKECNLRCRNPRLQPRSGSGNADGVSCPPAPCSQIRISTWLLSWSVMLLDCRGRRRNKFRPLFSHQPPNELTAQRPTCQCPFQAQDNEDEQSEGP